MHGSCPSQWQNCRPTPPPAAPAPPTPIAPLLRRRYGDHGAYVEFASNHIAGAYGFEASAHGTYYDMLPKRLESLGIDQIEEDIEVLRGLEVLVDGGLAGSKSAWEDEYPGGDGDPESAQRARKAASMRFG